MRLKKGKNFKFLLYSLLIIFLTSTNNYNYKISDYFNIDYVHITGFSDKKNNLIKNEIKEVFKKNIFLINSNYFVKITDRNDIKYLDVKNMKGPSMKIYKEFDKFLVIKIVDFLGGSYFFCFIYFTAEFI